MHIEIGHITTPSNPILDFLNSGFFSAAFGALAGAGIAYFLSERARKYNDLLREATHTNAAISICVDTLNHLFSLKSQLVTPMVLNYEEMRRTHIESNQSKSPERQTDEIITIKIDLKKFEPPLNQLSYLQNTIYEKIMLNGRPLSALFRLVESTELLNISIKKRNEITDGAHSHNSEEIRNFFLSLIVTEIGRDNQNDFSYRDLIYNTQSHLDDAIFFCHILCKDLMSHGDILKRKLKKKYQKNFIVNEVIFTDAESQNFFPSSEKYESWLSAFKVHDFANEK